jgi:hypothetical protein
LNVCGPTKVIVPNRQAPKNATTRFPKSNLAAVAAPGNEKAAVTAAS